jgi:hypothetical protein
MARPRKHHPFRPAILEGCDLSDIERQSLAAVSDNTHIGGPLDAPAVASSAPSASSHNLTVL